MQISETANGIVYREQLSLFVRMFVAAIGLALAVIGPAAMSSIGTPLWSVSFLMAIVTGVSLFVFGLVALAIALSSVKILEFMPATRQLRVTLRGPIQRSRSEHGFATVLNPEVAMRESEDGRYPVIVMGFRDGTRPLELVGFRGEADARHWRERIAGILTA